MTYNDRLSLGEEIRQAEYASWVEKASNRVNIVGNTEVDQPTSDLVLEMIADGELKNGLAWLRHGIHIVDPYKAVSIKIDDPEESVGGYPLVAVYIAHIPLPALDHKTLRSIDSMYSEIVASRPGRVSIQVFKDAPGVFSWLPIFSSDKDLTDSVWELIEESLKLIWEGYE